MEKHFSLLKPSSKYRSSYAVVNGFFVKMFWGPLFISDCLYQLEIIILRKPQVFFLLNNKIHKTVEASSSQILYNV